MNREFQHQQDMRQGSSQQPMGQQGQQPMQGRQNQQPMGQQNQQGQQGQQQPMGQQGQQPPMGQQGQQPMGQQSTGKQMQQGSTSSQQPMGQQGQLTGQATGQQMGGQHGQQMGGQQAQQMQPNQPAIQFDDHFTDELRILLEDFGEVTHIAEWCGTQCASAGPELADCARICADIAELAELNEKLIARDSMFGPEVADLFVRVATEGLPELKRHQQHHPHIMETIATIERTINSCSSVLEMGGQGRGQMPMQGQSQSQMPMQGQSQSQAHGQRQMTGSQPQQGRQQQRF